jgi:hypothetical protein
VKDTPPATPLETEASRLQPDAAVNSAPLAEATVETSVSLPVAAEDIENERVEDESHVNTAPEGQADEDIPQQSIEVCQSNIQKSVKLVLTN